MGDYENFYRQTPYGRPPGGMGQTPMEGKPVMGYNNQNNRFVGGAFLGPFLLGGLTGGLVAPFFYGPRPGPVYYPYPPYYPPYRPY